MADLGPLVLLVEDEPQMRRFLRTTLRAHECQVVEAGTAREALAQAAGRNPDLILLDLGLPDGDGLEVTRQIRRSARTPIIVLSARGQEHEKVTAFDLGVDDYLTKPFGVQELLARVRVALRHAKLSSGPPAPVFESGDLRVDLERRLVFRHGDEVHLTPTEYKLLVTLVRHAGKVLTHRHLLHEVWGANYEGQTHYLRVYM
ncbi:MAG: response regulator, partial [Gemmatimonadales bacterium]